MTYLIEKGVPIPPAKQRQGLTATLRQMEIGDSILFDGDRAGLHTAFRAVTGCKFITRKEGNKTRIWRVPLDE